MTTTACIYSLAGQDGKDPIRICKEYCKSLGIEVVASVHSVENAFLGISAGWWNLVVLPSLRAWLPEEVCLNRAFDCLCLRIAVVDQLGGRVVAIKEAFTHHTKFGDNAAAVFRVSASEASTRAPSRQLPRQLSFVE